MMIADDSFMIFTDYVAFAAAALLSPERSSVVLLLFVLVELEGLDFGVAEEAIELPRIREAKF